MTEPYHSLLKRQILRLNGDGPVPENWKPLLEQVDDAYRVFDRDRAMLERSMEISSQELLNANADIRAVLEGLINFYIRLNEAGKILYARGMERPPILEQNENLNGMDIREAVAPAARSQLADALNRLRIDGNLKIIECEIHAGGQQRFYEVRCIPAHNNHVSVIIRDTTEQKERVRREQALQQRLSRAERIESLGILAGGVAHDLNNILAPLVSYPDMLMESFDPSDPRFDMVRQMQQSVLRASAIIQDMLTMTRRGNNRADHVDVNRVMKDYFQSADFAELSQRYPHIRIHYDIEEILPHLRGSAHQLTQTIMNLVTNACESIGENRDGRVDIRIAVEDRPEAFGTVEEDEFEPYVMISVSDNGCGIPEEEQEHIFEPFFTRRKSGRSGTGLGLAIVYGTVKDYGGTIKVQSEVDKGTAFLLRLPIVRSRHHSMEEPHQKSERQQTTCRVLVVDDDENLLKLSRVLLTPPRYEVTTVSSGTQAVEYLRHHDSDIVLLDMIMEEDFDGLQTYEAIRTFKPDQVCLVVSGFAQTDRVKQALDLGVHSFVQKPYTMKTLHTAIEEALHSHEAGAAAG